MHLRAPLVLTQVLGYPFEKLSKCTGQKQKTWEIVPQIFISRTSIFMIGARQSLKSSTRNTLLCYIPLCLFYALGLLFFLTAVGEVVRE